MVEKTGAANRLEAKSPEKTEISGSYGIVIKPDPKTQQRAEHLAREMAPDAEFQVSFPHVTLYHARFENLPLQKVRGIVSDLRKHKHEILLLKHFEIFGGKLMFWNIQRNVSLVSMHERTLGLAKFLNNEAVSRAQEEGLNMATEELENVKKFGHPLVLNQYKPHITLAYDSKGLILPYPTPGERWWMKIDDIVFAEMGQYGSVARVVEP